jgi:hypothetical protein
VLDDDYVDGVGSILAHKLMMSANSKVHVVGLEDKSAGFSKISDNLPPSVDKIIFEIQDKLNSAI